jgi:hypothetical protein
MNITETYSYDLNVQTNDQPIEHKVKIEVVGNCFEIECFKKEFSKIFKKEK